MRISLLLASALALTACTRGAEARDNGDNGAAGSTISRDFPVGAFDKVALGGAQDVIVTVGGPASVRAEGDAEMIERLDIRVENGQLRIGSKRNGDWSFGLSHRRAKIVVHVALPALAAASIEGSGDMRIDKVAGDSFKGSIGGSGDMEIADLRVDRADFSIAGSGGITAKGSAQSSHISIAGSGDVDTGAFEAKTANISVIGSGDVRANATGTANISLMGSGDVMMSGPARCTVSKMGSGDVHCGG